MEDIKKLYSESMDIAYKIEDKLEYDETKNGKKFGKIINKLQKLKL